MEISDMDAIVDVLRKALLMSLWLCLPLLGIGLIVGLVVSLFQAVTQIQEQTLSFIPKILAVVLTIFIVLPLMLTLVVEYSRETIEMISVGIRDH